MTRRLITAVLTVLLSATPALADPGDPVSDYGDNGYVRIPPQDYSSVAPGELVIAPDGTAILDVGAGEMPGSVGEYGWAGAAKTYYWVDPVEDLVGIFMAQYMTGPENPDRAFRSVVYQAIVD